MLSFLADENFNGDIIRGLLFHQPDFDIIRVQDVSLSGFDDPELLNWASDHNRIILTHDRATMEFYAYQRLIESNSLAGVFVLNDRYPIGNAIRELLLMNMCSNQSEWVNRIVHIPL